MINNQVIMLGIAIIVLIALFFFYNKSEKFGFTSFRASQSGTINTCVPSDGVWSIPGGGAQGRSLLNSPCCQPPDYSLPDSYKTCSNYNEEPDSTIRACLEKTCNYVYDQAKNYDPSWNPMASCGASLCCYNSRVPHFAKYQTCMHYLEGDLAEATTTDQGEVSGQTGWRGYIGNN
jgi:hypothetical protein